MRVLTSPEPLAAVVALLAGGVLAMSLTGPWRRDSWWQARVLFGAAAFDVALGIAYFLG